VAPTRAAGAAAVVDDQLLAGLLGELRRQRPREGVGAAAGRERHDHHHRLGGQAACACAKARGGRRRRRRPRAGRRAGSGGWNASFVSFDVLGSKRSNGTGPRSRLPSGFLPATAGAVLVEPLQVVQVVHHQAERLLQALGRRVAGPVEAFHAGAVAEVEARHRVQRLAVLQLLAQVARRPRQQFLPLGRLGASASGCSQLRQRLGRRVLGQPGAQARDRRQRGEGLQLAGTRPSAFPPRA
jgi:hypothetical protein